MENYLNTIKEINLSFLHVAQSMLQHDKESALYRLGIDDKMATLIIKLTPVQMLKISELNQLIVHLRFTDYQSIMYLTQDSRLDALQQIHAGILLTTNLNRDIQNEYPETQENTYEKQKHS